MLNGDSLSCIRESGGVEMFRGVGEPAVAEGTTLPEIDRPCAPNGTGGLRIPVSTKTIVKYISNENIHMTILTHAAQSWNCISNNFASFQFLLALTLIICRHSNVLGFGT